MNSCFSLKTLYLYKVKHCLEKQKSNPPTAYIILKYHTVSYFSTVMTALIIWTLVKTDTGYFWHKEQNIVHGPKNSLNKVLYVTVSFSLEKVLMEDSFQYLLKNVYYSFSTLVIH